MKSVQRDDLFAPSLKCRSHRQKIVEAILSSNLRQHCINKTFAEDSILNRHDRFFIYLGVFSRINHCLIKIKVPFHHLFWFSNDG